MALIIGPYTVTRGEILPADRESRTDQDVEKAEDGSIYVVERDFDELYLKATLKDSQSIIENVIYFLRNGVRYSAVPFYITDGFGTQWYVRYWGGKNIKWTYVGASLVQLNLTLRVEVS